MRQTIAKQQITSVGVFTNITRINDELHIAHRSVQKKPTWYLLKLVNQWPRFSLGTQDKREATAKALRAYQAFCENPDGDWRAACGNTTHHVSFKEVAESWLATVTQDKAYKEGVLRKFLIPFFHIERQLTSIQQINAALIDDYKVWRRNFWPNRAATCAQRHGIVIPDAHGEEHFEEPSATTLNREYPTLRQILKYAAKHGHFGSAQPPDVPAEKVTINRRPAFTPEDFATLVARAESWTKEARDEATRMKRQLLWDWIMVNRYTGLRLPHEAAKLTWADIDFEHQTLRVAPNTKTGARVVPLIPEAVRALQTLQQRRLAAMPKGSAGSLQGEPVFVLANGSPYGDLPNLFQQLVKLCGFVRRTDELPYTPYSLRHTFATQLMPKLPYKVIADMMGTSTKMLDQHYVQGSVDQARAAITRMEAATAASACSSVNNDEGSPLVLISEGDLPADHHLRRRASVVS